MTYQKSLKNSYEIYRTISDFKKNCMRSCEFDLQTEELLSIKTM